MKFICFLVLWTFLAFLFAFFILKFVRRHEKVYILLILNCFYLLGVFLAYNFFVLFSFSL